MWSLDSPTRAIKSGNSFAIDCFNTQIASIALISVFGQGLCVIVITSWSNKSGPNMGR